MGTTHFTGLSISGALDVTGAISGSSTIEADGAATLNSTLYVSGDVTMASDLDVTGDATCAALTASGEARMGGVFGVGSAAVLGAIDDNADDYSFLYCDGTNVKSSGFMLYDHGTSAWRNCYLLNGTLTAV